MRGMVYGFAGCLMFFSQLASAAVSEPFQRKLAAMRKAAKHLASGDGEKP